MENWVQDLLTLLLALLFGLFEYLVRRSAKRKARPPVGGPTRRTRRDSSGEAERLSQERQAALQHLEALSRMWQSERGAVARALGEWAMRPVGDVLGRFREELEGAEARRSLDALRQRLRALERTVDTLVALAGERSGDERHDLLWADRILADLARMLPAGHLVASFQRDGRLETEPPIRAVAVPRAWTRDLTLWPPLAEASLRSVAAETLVGEARHRAGLPDRWAVSYIEPMYLASEEILGPFGGWLDVLAGDLLGVLRLGPVWYRVLASQAPGPVWTVRPDPAGLHLEPTPPVGIRLAFLAGALRALGVAGFEELPSAGEALVAFPTRRGTVYQVTAEPFVEAAARLAEFFLAEPWEALGGADLASLADRAAWEEAELVARHRWAGTARPAARLAAGLILWLDAPGAGRPALAEALLSEARREARRSARPVAVGEGPLAVEAMLLVQILRPRFARRPRPWLGDWRL